MRTRTYTPSSALGGVGIFIAVIVALVVALLVAPFLFMVGWGVFVVGVLGFSREITMWEAFWGVMLIGSVTGAIGRMANSGKRGD